MAYNSLADFVQVLAQQGELKRITYPVKAELEIAEIADRVMKSNGPALLFVNVVDKKISVLINAFGSMNRMGLALAINNVAEIASEIESLIRLKPPRSIRDKRSLFRELSRLAGIPPELVKDATSQETTVRDPDLGIFP